MNKQGFQEFLLNRKLNGEQVAQHIEITAQFERYLGSLIPPLSLETATAEATQGFVDQLIADGANSYDNLVALARYGRFSQNNELYVAILELLDGEEAFAGIYHRIGEVAGIEKRAEIFDDFLVPPLGTNSREKSRLTQVLMERLDHLVDPKTQSLIFSNSFRDLQDEYYQEDKQKYWEIGDIDKYLEIKREEFLAELEQIMTEGRLFFSQEITPEVIEYVRGDLEISQGVRQDNILYVTKIPYMAKEYLAETDPEKKRYFYCHCPWARESLRKGETIVSAKFCQCSAGFHKKAWEVIFGKPLQAEVLESVLKGDMRCRFAIHLPEEIRIGED
ncbi:MAG: hypothetical protein IH586_16125 [Anaerolineaceae bacterium]|nr:hypothetical protein [Anaerolineaceae bacterium]